MARASRSTSTPRPAPASADAAEAGRRSRTRYPRSTGSPRGEARRRELLSQVTDDLAANGLVDFSLRRAARAAGTTHKVLLYHFDDVDDLLRQAIVQLRERRIANAMTAARRARGRRTLAGRIRAVWPVLVGEESRILDQAIGLTMYDPDRYRALGHGASQHYLRALIELCPAEWTEKRKREVAEMILATLRGFLVDRLTSGDDSGVRAGFAALTRALEREEGALDRK